MTVAFCIFINTILSVNFKSCHWILFLHYCFSSFAPCGPTEIAVGTDDALWLACFFISSLNRPFSSTANRRTHAQRGCEGETISCRCRTGPGRSDRCTAVRRHIWRDGGKNSTFRRTTDSADVICSHNFVLSLA